MITFVLVIVLVTFAALTWILHPLLSRDRSAAPGAVPDAAATSLAWLAEDLRTIEQEARDGGIDGATLVQSRVELQRRMLDEAERSESPRLADAPRRSWPLAAALLLGVPLAGGLLYLHLGDTGALSPAPPASARTDGHPTSETQLRSMIARLQARLQADVDDVEGWSMLARSTLALGEYRQAEQAQRRIVDLRPRDAQAWADLADVTALLQGRRFGGEPITAIERALSLDPRHPKALALAASAAIERSDPRAAIGYWERLLPLVSPGSDFERSLRASIDRARQSPGPAGTVSDSRPLAEISGTVRLASGLVQRMSAEDTLLVFARAVDGPRMPLAVLRRRAGDLPLSFRLDESMAMDQRHTIASASRIVVTARISRSGSAEPRAGDLEGASAPVAAGARDVVVEISRLIE